MPSAVFRWGGRRDALADTVSRTGGSAESLRSQSLLGLAYMAGGIFLFSAVDTQAKFLTDTLHPLQIAWSRQFGLLIGVFVILGLRGPAVLKTDRPILQILRGAAVAGSATLFIIALKFVPLADAVAVAFVAPFIVTVLGATLLGEPVGIHRWTAVTIGFLGALIVIRPGLGVIHPAAMLVVLAAFLFALRQILSRTLSTTSGTATTVAYTAIVGSFILTLPLPFVWQWPGSTRELVLLASLAIMSAVAELLVIKALEVAQAVVVAPVQYTMLIWGTLYGYFIFGDLPDRWTWIGALIIIATGFYTLYRERLAATRS